MALRYLWLDGVSYSNRVLVDVFPYVSPPVMKRQTVEIPGANGLVDVTPRIVYEERNLQMRVVTADAGAIAAILAKQGQIVEVSVEPLWAGKFWRGRLTLPAQMEFGAEHRTFLDVQVHPYLLEKKSSGVLNLSTTAQTRSFSSASVAVPKATVTGSVELRATVGGVPRVWALSAGTHRVTGLRFGPAPLGVTMKSLSGTSTVALSWEDGQLWIG